MSITITDAQYQSLLAAANGDTQIDVGSLKSAIDAANGIVTYVLQIRWYEAGGAPPKAFDLRNGEGWPSQQQVKLTMTRPITRDDTDTVLSTSGINPVDPTVTRDPEGIVGWTLIDDYNYQANV